MLSFLNSNWKKSLAVTLALAGVLAFAGCGQQQQAKSNVIAVKSMQVKRQDTPDAHEFTGFIEAQQEAKITANVSGRITSKNFNGGDYVRAGQVLFTIDQRTYRANELKAQADLANARAELAPTGTRSSMNRTPYPSRPTITPLPSATRPGLPSKPMRPFWKTRGSPWGTRRSWRPSRAASIRATCPSATT